MGVSRQHFCELKRSHEEGGLEAKAAAEGRVPTEAQVAAREKLRAEQETTGEEIETHHPGFLVSHVLRGLQEDLNAWLGVHTQERPHQGRRCQGRTPLQTFLDRTVLVRERMLA